MMTFFGMCTSASWASSFAFKLREVRSVYLLIESCVCLATMSCAFQGS